MHTSSFWVTQEITRKASPRRTIVKSAYTMHSDMVYAKNDPRRWNSNSFVNPKVVSLYVNFSRMQLLHTISIWVSQEIVGNVSLRTKIVKWDKTMSLSMVYYEDYPRKWNANDFFNPDVLSCMSTSRACNFCIESSFGMLKRPIKSSL